MHKSSVLKMRYFKENYLNPDTELKILDIGSFDKSGDYNYGMILNEDNWTYHGLDLKEGNNVDIIVKDPYKWDEIEDGCYDLIISGQAFEHIEYFWLTLEEIKRIMKPGGMLFIIVPSAGPVHKNPYDCYRFQEDGMKAMAKYINFEIIEFGTDYDDSSTPWHDSILVARKPEVIKDGDISARIDNVEYKMDLILQKIKR